MTSCPFGLSGRNPPAGGSSNSHQDAGGARRPCRVTNSTRPSAKGACRCSISTSTGYRWVERSDDVGHHARFPTATESGGANPSARCAGGDGGRERDFRAGRCRHMTNSSIPSSHQNLKHPPARKSIRRNERGRKFSTFRASDPPARLNNEIFARRGRGSAPAPCCPRPLSEGNRFVI